jgi:beta-xylosidase
MTKYLPQNRMIALKTHKKCYRVPAFIAFFPLHFRHRAVLPCPYSLQTWAAINSSGNESKTVTYEQKICLMDQNETDWRFLPQILFFLARGNSIFEKLNG